MGGCGMAASYFSTFSQGNLSISPTTPRLGWCRRCLPSSSRCWSSTCSSCSTSHRTLILVAIFIHFCEMFVYMLLLVTLF
jgi:hypothetical protein